MSENEKTNTDGNAPPVKPSFSDFNTAMSHFYRGEVYRSSVWRVRLDATTNWSVVATATALSFAFSGPHRTQMVFMLTTVLVSLLMGIESRRFRFFDVWRERVRLLEENFVVPHLTGAAVAPREDWKALLASDLLRPHFKMSPMEAVARRLRRNYCWIFLTIYLSWITKLWMHPTPAATWGDVVRHATLVNVPGWLVFSLYSGYHLFLLGLIVWVGFHRQEWGEIREPKKGFAWRRDDEPSHLTDLFQETQD